MAALARSQVAAARRRLGLSTEEFAEVLTPLLGWAPSPGVVENWETTATPPGDVLIAATMVTQAAPLGHANREDEDLLHQLLGGRFADVEAVFATRSEFMYQMPPNELFNGADRIDAAGLSLNPICQQYPDDQLRRLIQDGTTLRCLFLAPYGDSIAAREREEDYSPGNLSALTEMNIQILSQRVRQRLPDEHRTRIQIATYDETIRFNIMLIDQQIAVIQPYLPAERGVESPTFLLRRHPSGAGLFPVFEQTFAWLWERSTPHD
jgi:hypothetical protein